MSSDFKSARELYYDRIKLTKALPSTAITNLDSKYARAAELGLCFHCFREDENPKHRPRHLAYAFCDECMTELSIGLDKIERLENQETEKWFK